MFHRWQNWLPPEWTVMPVALPGREHRLQETPVADWQTLLDALLGAWQRQESARTVFFGHSFGALLAYQLALELRSHELPLPMGLILSGCPAPNCLPRQEQLHQLDDESLIATLIQRYDLSEDQRPGELELMRLLLPTIRADLTLFESYAYQATTPFTLPLVIMGGTDDIYVSRPELEQWRSFTRGMFQCRMFPGRHFYYRANESWFVNQIATICAKIVAQNSSTLD